VSVCMIVGMKMTGKSRYHFLIILYYSVDNEIDKLEIENNVTTLGTSRTKLSER
jgi:hypothetical protein